MRTIERQGAVNAPFSVRYPNIKGGACERHGTIDPKQPATVQYLLCGCFNELGEVRCSYCPDAKDPNEVIRISEMKVAVNPDNPNKVIAWCDSFECSDKHLKRFKISA